MSNAHSMVRPAITVPSAATTSTAVQASGAFNDAVRVAAMATPAAMVLNMGLFPG